MKKILFFGDSLTSGENNNFISFVDKLNLKNYTNYGVSGTTLGDYSLYPVGKNNLIDLIEEHQSEIKTADIIFLEYGCNDISSVEAGYTNLNTVIISLVKCIDYITQLNPKVQIYFISLGVTKNIFSKGQVDYLNTCYLKNSDISIVNENWISTYMKFESIMSSIIKNHIVLSTKSLSQDLLDMDNLHPNDKGYSLIAEEIKNQLGEFIYE